MNSCLAWSRHAERLAAAVLLLVGLGFLAPGCGQRADREAQESTAISAQAESISCETQCGMAAGACHLTCSSNGPCHAACDAAQQQCLAGCQPCSSCGQPDGSVGTQPPAPTGGFVSPKFVVLTVIYAPPGQMSTVNYQNNQTMGSKTSWTKAFTQTATAGIAVNRLSAIFAGTEASESWTQSADSSGSISISSSVTSNTTFRGPKSDNILHDADTIAVWLNAKADFTYDAPSSTWKWKWAVDSRDNVIGMDVVYLHVFDLKNPASLANNVRLQRTWAGPGQGLTAEDYEQILNTDPFARGETSISGGRFSPFRSVPYTKPACNGGVPITQPITANYTLNFSTTTSQSSTATSEYKVTLITNITSGFLTFKNGQSYAWTNKAGKELTTSTGTGASFSLTGPSDCSYQGEETIDVYQDNVYGTFMFAYPSQPGAASRGFLPILPPNPITPPNPPPSVDRLHATVSATVPTTMVAGDVYPATFTITNTGLDPWQPSGAGCNAILLGSANPRDNTTWGTGRVALPRIVEPGGSVTVSTQVTAPIEPGTYNFQWQMLQECVTWFGTPSNNVVVTVTPLSSDPSDFYTVAPCRVLDTRNPGGAPLAAGTDRIIQLKGQCGIPSTAKAVSANITVTQTGAPGHLTLYPAGSVVPVTSSINYLANATRANNAIVPAHLAVRCAQATGSTHFILDVNGYFE